MAVVRKGGVGMSNYQIEAGTHFKTIRRYEIVCPSCQGRGFIQSPNPIDSNTVITFPACGGKKTIIVEESNV